MSTARNIARSSDIHYVPVSQSEERRASSQPVMDTESGHSTTLKVEPPASPTRLRQERRTASHVSTSKFVQMYQVVRKPRAFLKLLQCLVAVLAFSAASDSPHLISIFCKDNLGTYVKYSYPYRMSRTSIKACANKCFLTSGDRCSGAAHFFVFIGVVSLLLGPALFITQLVFNDNSKRTEQFRLIELGIAAVMAICWFAGSIAWSTAVSEIRQITNPTYIAGMLQAQTKFIGCEIFPATNASLVISVLFGFCNFLLWGLLCYFIVKETSFFNRHRSAQEMQSIPTTTDPARSMTK